MTRKTITAAATVLLAVLIAPGVLAQDDPGRVAEGDLEDTEASVAPPPEAVASDSAAAAAPAKAPEKAPEKAPGKARKRRIWRWKRGVKSSATLSGTAGTTQGQEAGAASKKGGRVAAFWMMLPERS